jgi:hypothetical protein
MSYCELHTINKRATQEQLTKYKMALQLFKLFNGYQPILGWLSLNQHLVLASRHHFFEITSHTNYKIGNRFLSDRLHCLNKKIPLAWLSQSFNSFKLKCKNSIFVDVNLSNMNLLSIKDL